MRAKWSLGRELARRVAGGRLPRWECAEVVAAEASSSAPPGQDGPSDLDEVLRPGASLGEVVGRPRAGAAAPSSDADGVSDPAGVGGDDARDRGEAPGEAPGPPRAVDAPPLSLELARLVAGLRDADAFELDRRLRWVLHRERTHEARIGPLLRRVLEGRLYRWRGYWDRDRYVEERLGMCSRKARALVRIERALERSSGLARAYRAGHLSWVQAQALAPLFEAGVGAHHGDAWTGRARRVTVRRLGDDVRAALALADLDPARFAQTGGLPEDSQVPQEENVRERETRAGGEDPPVSDGGAGWQTRAPRGEEEDATIAFSAPAESARFLRAVLEEVRGRLARARGGPVSEGEAFEAMLDHAIRAWSVRDERVRRDHRIFERDGWRCAVPGCTSHRNLQVHHIVFRSHGGGDEPENLITLCAWHHQRGVHGGRVRIIGRAPDRLRFELGLRDGRPPLLVYESGDLLVE